MNRPRLLNDPVLFGLALACTLVGMVLVFDAGYARALQQGRGMIPPEFRSQAMFLPVALLVGALVARFPSDFWRRAATGVWFVSLLSLIGVKLFGHELNGAQRWIDLGPVSIQPAEFAKAATVLYLAAVFAHRKPWTGPAKRPKDWANWLDHVAVPKLRRAVPAILVLIAVVLIEKEPDLGTAAVVAATAFAMFVAGGVSGRSIAAMTVLGALGVGFMIHQEPYRLERIENHAHRWSADHMDDTGYQTVQSEIAMASGGWTGVGIGAGRAKHVLPATTTDFIMATVGEEFGLVGALAVLGLLAALCIRLLMSAASATSTFARMVLCGTAAWIGIQTITNVMMANGTLPAIGIPLPFISSGGSSLAALWIAVGLCQSVLSPAPATQEEPVASRNHRWRNRRTRLSRA